MPTMGRLVAAVLYGILGWYVTLLIIPLFPEEASLGWFQELNALCGIVVGWKVAGPRAGTGYVSSVSYGLTTTVSLVVVALFFNSFFVMIEKSFRKAYDGAGEAVGDIFALFVEHGTMIGTPEIVTALAVGGLAAAVVVEFFGRRFT